jgi:endonuclease/exonuclease/phosphatase (EEP) superfamily protein YafD
MHLARRALPFLFATVLLAACRTGRNDTAPDVPRYADTRPADASPARPASLLLVSFNIAFARHVDRALAVLRAEPAVRRPEVLLLQEMDAPSVACIARELGMAYVYNPALLHRGTGRDFGNAVLSRWPIIAEERLVLPHRSLFTRTQRIATAATIDVAGLPVRVYSAHLGTFTEITPRARRDQLRHLLANAERFSHVVIGGDMNGGGVARVALDRGFGWPTQSGPRTTSLGRWDHLLPRGFARDGRIAGTVRDVRGSRDPKRDHKPVWTRAALDTMFRR